MWITDNYRRIFLDMHIDDHDERFLSKLEPKKLIENVKACGGQCVVVKAKPHTGLCYWPCTVGRMHKGLKGMDYVGTMIDLAHKAGLAVMVYYSQVFDNYAYDNHPEWRTVWCDGLNSREKEHYNFRKGRYGECCPNNPEYRAYVKHNLQELTGRYQFEGYFLDMPFWPEVCYCPSCRRRYLEETGKNLPRFVDWNDPEWKEFQLARERWIGEFAAFSTKCVKEINPDVTIEHNFATGMYPWQYACNEAVADASDYVGGDYYDGFLQQSFACKYYRNVTKRLPFCYISSRCDPDLLHHTTTKTAEAFVQHGITALVHNGSFSICDGLNPDGTITEKAYTGPIRDAFAMTKPYEKYVSGDYVSNVAIWFPTHSKYDFTQNGTEITEQIIDVGGFAKSKIGMAGLLRENHVPFDVIPGRSIRNLKSDVLVISDVSSIADEEMSDIKAYLERGGNVYLSGHIGNPELLELLGAEYEGMTPHNLTYMAPRGAGCELLQSFDDINPLSIGEAQHLLKLHGDAEVLATITLPYTVPGTPEFASIHSNPPGIPTKYPALIRKQTGKGQIIWAAAPIEKLTPYMSRLAVLRTVLSLCGTLHFEAEAPGSVEVMGWKKDGKMYYSVINQQESMPIWPVSGISITLPYEAEQVRLLDGKKLTVHTENGRTEIKLPKMDLFSVLEVTEKAVTRNLK